jgi:outer membrane protein TolC
MSSMPSLSVTAVSALLGMTPAQMQQQIHNGATELGAVVGQVGNKVLDAFDTDTHNVFAGSVMLTQPIFMGGAIIAMNKLANINEDMVANSAEAKRQATLYNIDQTYW